MALHLEYKGYKTNIKQDLDIFYGKIINISDLVSFEGFSMEDVKENFIIAVDDYIETCKKLNKPVELKEI